MHWNEIQNANSIFYFCINLKIYIWFARKNYFFGSHLSKKFINTVKCYSVSMEWISQPFYNKSINNNAIVQTNHQFYASGRLEFHFWSQSLNHNWQWTVLYIQIIISKSSSTELHKDLNCRVFSSLGASVDNGLGELPDKAQFEVSNGEKADGHDDQS